MVTFNQEENDRDDLKAAYAYPEVEVGQVWRSLDPRDVQRNRHVIIEAVDPEFVFVRPMLDSGNGRRSRIHRSRFDGVQFEVRGARG